MIEPVISVMIVRIVVALLLGMAIGFERIVRHKSAGMRTYALVSMAAALFVSISEIAMMQYLQHGMSNAISMSPIHVAASVVTGIGFLGAGLIFHNKEHVDNLTTASAMWAAAAIGVACGFGYVTLAIAATVLVLIVLSGLHGIEEALKHKLYSNSKDSSDAS